jgi:hypothetical protein
MSILEYIQAHPYVALVVGVVHLLAAEKMQHYPEIPSIVMQVFQVAAWSVTIAVGLISIYGTLKKWRKK